MEATDLQAARGAFIVIAGPSGCGKSIFLKLTTGPRQTPMGKILIDGKPSTGPVKISDMTFQAPSLLFWRTTLDNVPLEIVKLYHMPFRQRRPESSESARTLLAKAGLEGQADKFPWELSGGMQQRASSCRALIHEPLMLILNEPFRALDATLEPELEDGRNGHGDV